MQMQAFQDRASVSKCHRRTLLLWVESSLIGNEDAMQEFRDRANGKNLWLPLTAILVFRKIEEVNQMGHLMLVSFSLKPTQCTCWLVWPEY